MEVSRGPAVSRSRAGCERTWSGMQNHPVPHTHPCSDDGVTAASPLRHAHTHSPHLLCAVAFTSTKTLRCRGAGTDRPQTHNFRAAVGEREPWRSPSVDTFTWTVHFTSRHLTELHISFNSPNEKQIRKIQSAYRG